MIHIRNNVFETNSSMTHCLVICKALDYNEWTSGRSMFKYDEHKFLPNNEALKANGKILRNTVKLVNKELHGNSCAYWQKKLNVLTEENIKNYEEGLKKAKKWEFYSYYEFSEFYITFEEWKDYVEQYLEMIPMCESDYIDEIRVTSFGYYGHD